jgi:hypothetical protein
MREVLDRRVRQVRSRLALRDWEYRQRRHAAGVWFRLRRVLADASAAFEISESAARQLISEGHDAEPVGTELEPPKIMLFVPADRITRIPGAREIPVRLGPELLAARHLALTRFP